MKITLDLDTECFNNGYYNNKLYYDGKYYATWNSYKNLIHYIDWSYKTELVRKLYDNRIDILKCPVVVNNEIVYNNGEFATLCIDLDKLFTLYVTLLLDKSHYNNYDKLFISKDDFKSIIKSDFDSIVNDNYTINLRKDSTIYIDLTIIYKPTIKQSFIQSTSVIEAYSIIYCEYCGTQFETINCPTCGYKRID